MKITLFSLDRLRLIRMNKNSVVVRYEGSDVFISRKIYNRFLNQQQVEGIILPRTYNGISTNWFHVLTPFG